MAPKVIGIVTSVLRFGLAGIFIYAGGLHAWDAPKFVQSIQAYDLLPPDMTMLLGVYLPWVEILAGLGLLVRRLYLGSLAAIGGLLLVFLGALISAQTRGLDISCGCFRAAESIKTHFPQLIARDAAMLAAVALLWWRERREQRQDATVSSSNFAPRDPILAGKSSVVSR
jgi:uncharacterized membrane protein YphA (DoxX/SURF4 family)